MSKVGNAMVVHMHYTLKNTEGEVLDSSEKSGEPMAYLHGARNIIEGLEDELEDLGVGDTFDVVVPADKGYGTVQKRLINEIPRDRFPSDAEVQVGSRFVLDRQGSPTQVKVIAIEGDQITIDANHDLAGQDLHFAGSIVSIREGTPQELSHGHPHGPGGHHH
jgi:FKBP-type peptidyl-prolyl cis-trans isomerase SlyD